MLVNRRFKRGGVGSKTTRPRVFGGTKREYKSVPVPMMSTVTRKVARLADRIELKHKDTLVSTTINSTAAFNLLNGIAVGNTNVTRVGQDVNGTSFQFRCIVSLPNTILTEMVARHIIFYDRQANAGTPTVGSILDAGTISTVVLQPYNENFFDRYRILYDKTLVLRPQVVNDFDIATGGTSELVPSLVYSKKKRPCPRRTKYSGTDATAASVETNALWSMWVTNNASNINVTCGYRYYFKDA